MAGPRMFALQARAGSPGDDNGSVVFWTDIFLLLVLGIFVIAALPRSFVRFIRLSGWRKGVVLYRTSVIPEETRSTQSGTSFTLEPSSEKNSKNTTSVKAISGYYEAQPHLESLTSRWHTLACIFREPILPRMTVGRALLLIFYFAVLLFAALFRNSVFKNPIRAGALAASQIPWVYILATKNNVIGTLLGLGYERLNYLHRFAGRLLVLAGNVHAIGYIYKWVNQGVWTQRTKMTYVRWGLVALVSLDILFFFSLHIIRRKAYNVFISTHLIALVVFLVAICIHMRFAVPYVAIAAGFYGADRVLRIVKSRAPVAHLQAIPDLSTTLIRIPAINAGWRAGQHVRLRVLSSGMGILGWAEVHPYSIANACEGAGSDGLVLMAKKNGRWSRNLYELAERGDEQGWHQGGHRVRVIVEGPYGGPGNTVLSSFSGALFISGGSGISFALAGVQEVLQLAAIGQTNVRTIDLVWSVHHVRVLCPLLSLFGSLLRQSYATPVSLNIHVHHTRAMSQEDEERYPHGLPEGMTLTAGRAWLPYILTEFVDRTAIAISRAADGSGSHGVVVATCGPVSLADDVRSAFSRIDMRTRRSIGGLELHEEAFHW
ncbi:hypothetical protein NM688_g432 [Phlebia brevispora]|uniref:Uncharacterized protein n=1 Tax=Phlebia brevispora TaxID=194682 RepID=A0ACC1TE08_9APHY|nr:hypothetical protein NM688_g432 [Phlebia brevispora]